MDGLKDMLKLYTFNVSHFAEKARWALDYFEASLRDRPTWKHVLRM